LGKPKAGRAEPEKLTEQIRKMGKLDAFAYLDPHLSLIPHKTNTTLSKRPLKIQGCTDFLEAKIPLRCKHRS